MCISTSFRFFSSACLLWLALQATPAISAETPPKDESEFFSVVNETGGYITPRLHEEFWAYMKTKYDEKVREKLVIDVQKALAILQEFQVQTWLSAKNSYFSRKVDKTAEYEPLRRLISQQQSPYFSTQAMSENSEKIISASASRTAIDLGAGKFYITPELIEENRIGIQGSYDRLKMLLNPQWHEDYREFNLPLMHMSLLSLYAPDEYHEVITHGDESIDIHLAQLTTGKNSVYEIGLVDYQREDKKFNRLTLEERTAYQNAFIKEQFAGYRINNPLMSQGTWREHEFNKGTATVNDTNIIIMSLFVNNKAFYIKYITDNNLTLANADFTDFTKRIQLLESAAQSAPARYRETSTNALVIS